MSLQKKAEMFFQLGHSNVEIAHTLKVRKDYVRKMRRRFNKKVNQNKKTETITLPEVQEHLTEIDSSIKSTLPSCKKMKLKS